jgi:hypothetical protein
MNDARTMLGFGFILIMCVIVIDSLSGQSFTESGANKLRDEAVSFCIGRNDPKNPEVEMFNFNACRNNHPIERYLIDWFDYVLFFLFVFPVLFAVVVTTGLSMDSFSTAKPLSISAKEIILSGFKDWHQITLKMMPIPQQGNTYLKKKSCNI